MSFNKGKATFGVHDDYYTPLSAWKNLQTVLTRRRCLIPTGTRKRKRTRPLRVWEPFMLHSNGQSKRNLESLGYTVLGDTKKDFFDLSKRPRKSQYDLIVSNPPFARIRSWNRRHESLKYRCLEGLFQLDKPFVVIINSLNICSKWFQELVKGREKDVKFIYPTQKINFTKYKTGGKEEIKMENNSASFLSVYLCYKVLKQNEWI